MSDDQVYKDGDIVWVKLGNNWWPGEVIDAHRHPDGIVTNIKRKLYCIVKFFNENAYEYVSNVKQIYPFQCPKKEEFLKKGLSLYKSGNKFMEKFPEDVEVAERLTRPKASSLFINDRPDSIVKAILGQPLVLTGDDEYCGSSEYREKRRSSESITKIINITPNKPSSTTPTTAPIRIEHFITAAASSSAEKNNAKNISISSRTSIGDLSSRNNATNANNSNNNYRCNLCEFTSVRQNVMILHRKMHSNRNAPLPITTNHNASQNRNNHINPTDSNTKVNKTIVTKSPRTAATTTTTATQNTSKTSLNTPANVVTNETIDESTNSSKNSSSTIVVVADSSSSELEREDSPVVANETQSRRSMRHVKATGTVVIGNSTPSAAAAAHSVINGSTLSIDLPETTKPIKKIPKKRDFGSLNLQQEDAIEIEIPAVAQEVQIPPAATATATTTTPPATPSTAKDNAEEIRNMLLADWSDEDETPDPDNDRNQTDKSSASKNDQSIASNNEIMLISPDHTVTSTPLNSSKSLHTGRIRNIPKKDRRDVILHDFSGDLSMIETVKEIPSSHAPLVVHLDSSNSSAVEIIEEQQPPIITINDDDEDPKEKDKEKVATDIAKSNDHPANNDKLSPSRNSDLENVEPNDKSIVASILSCFDFQDDDDDEDIDTPTAVASSIAHFKKKYLSSERSQNQMANDGGGGGDISRAAKEKHEERAQKDQELTAEIESLLEQTQPPAADLLTSSNSFEECMSVKDLPIKERGKRIFKSRNRSRIEGKSSTESLTNSMSTDESITKEVSTTNDMNYTPAKEKRGSMDDNQTKEVGGGESFPVQHSNDVEKSSTDDIVAMASEDQSSGEIEENLSNDRNTNEENSAEVVIDPISHDKENYISEEISDNRTQNDGEEENLVVEMQEIEVTTNQVVVETSSVEEIPIEHERLEKPSTPISPKELDTENIKSPINHDDIRGKSPINHDEVDNDDIRGKSPAIENTEFPIDDNKPANEHVVEQNIEEEEANRETSKANEINQNADKQIEEIVGINESHVEGSRKAIEVADINQDEEEEVISVDVEEGNTTNGITQSKTLELTSTAIERSPEVAGEENKEVVIESRLEVAGEENEEVVIKTRLAVASEENQEVVIETRLEVAGEENQEVLDVGDDKSHTPTPTVTSEVEQIPAEEFANHRMINTSPMDENSSMGASDTGAEFGSPASMLSEERLPSFPFNRNKTPHQEVEATENETKMKTVIKASDSLDSDKTNITENSIAPKETIVDEVSNAEKETCNEKDDINVETKEDMTTTSGNVFKEIKEDENQSTEIEVSSESTSKSISDKIGPNVEPPVQTVKEFVSPPSEIVHRRKRRHVKNTPRRKVNEVFQHFQTTKTPSKDLAESLSTENDFNTTGSHDGEPNSVQENLDADCKKSEAIESELPKVVTEPSRVVKPTDNMEEGPAENAETPPSASCEESRDNNEISENLSTEEIVVNVGGETPTNEAIENVEETVALEETVILEDHLAINNEEKIIESIDTSTKPDGDDDIPKDKNEEKSASEDTSAANEPENNVTSNVPRENSSEAEETGCRNEKPKDKTSDAHQLSTSQCSIEDLDAKEANRDTNNTKPQRNLLSTQKKRSGETILLAKTKHRKQEAEADVTNENKEAIKESVAETDEVSTSKPSQIDSDKTQGNFEEKLDKDPPERELRSLSPTTRNQSNSETCTEKNSVVNSGGNHDMEIPLSPSIPQEKEVTIECESVNPALTTTQKDLIIECETTVPTPTHIIDFDTIGPTSPTSDDKDVVIECGTAIPKEKDIIVEIEAVEPHSNLQVNDIIEYDDGTAAAAPIVLGSDVVVVSAANRTSTDDHQVIAESNEHHHLQVCDTLIVAEPSATEPESEADKATHDFLIEFDNLVNQTTKQNEEEVLNANDIINNIIVEVQGDNPQHAETNETVDDGETISPPKTSQRPPLYRQITSIKRRKTICFDISDSGVGGVSRKRQVYDFEDSQPTTTRALKRTAERKMTMPDIDRSHSNPFGFDKQFKSFRPRRRSSIEDNITSYAMQRPNVAHDEDELYQELFETPSSTSSTDSSIYPSTKHHRPNKSFVSESIGSNKYVFIKNTTSQETTKSALPTKAANGRNMKRKASQTRTTAGGRRSSMHSENPPQSKIPRDATGCVAIQPKPPKPEVKVATLNDNQISTAQQQLIQLQQQPQTQSSSSIILNTNSNRARKTHKSAHNQQQQQNSNQLASVQQIQLLQQQNALQQQQQQQQQLQQQLITQLATNQQNVLQFVAQPVQQQPQQHIQHVAHANEGFIITTAAPSEDDNVIDSNTQLIALPTQPYPGYTETFLLCKVKGNTCKPVDNVPLYLNHQLNELVPIPADVLEAGPKLTIGDNSSDSSKQQINQQTTTTQELLIGEDKANTSETGMVDELECSSVLETETVEHQDFLQQDNGDATTGGSEATADLTTNNGILLNIEGQQVLLDAATFAHLLANPDTNTQLISDDGTEYVLTHEVLQALHMQQQQQEQQQQQQEQQEVLSVTNAEVNNDIIAVAMAGSDLYGNGVLTIDTSQALQLMDGSVGSVVFHQPTAPTLVHQHLTPPAVVTNAVLDQSPIMSALEVPSNSRLQVPHCITVPSLPIVTPSNVVLGGSTRSNLDDSLAAIGVTAQPSSISSSLGLPITVTDPNIASKVTSAGPLNEILQFVSHRPASAQAAAAAVAAAALAGETRIFND